MIDIGANLANAAFSHDLNTVLTRASACGVAALVATGTSLVASQRVSELATQRHALPIVCTSGIHPHAASTATAQAITTIEHLAALPACVAVGETGLDYHRMLSTKEEQRAAFLAQMGIATRLGKPLFLHCRDAFEDMHAMLADFSGAAVVHCFTGTRSQARAWLDLGYDIGITGWLTQSRASDLQDAVNYIPVDRLHIETDAPYLLPSTAVRAAPVVKMNGGWRCEPMHLGLVLNALAQCKKMDPHVLKEQLSLNAVRLFGNTLAIDVPQLSEACSL